MLGPWAYMYLQQSLSIICDRKVTQGMAFFLPFKRDACCMHMIVISVNIQKVNTRVYLLKN